MSKTPNTSSMVERFRRSQREDLPHNKPLKGPAAGFGCAGTVLNAGRNSITRGCSLAAIREPPGWRRGVQQEVRTEC